MQNLFSKGLFKAELDINIYFNQFYVSMFLWNINMYHSAVESKSFLEKTVSSFWNTWITQIIKQSTYRFSLLLKILLWTGANTLPVSKMGQVFHFLVTTGYQISLSFVDVFCCGVHSGGKKKKTLMKISQIFRKCERARKEMLGFTAVIPAN